MKTKKFLIITSISIIFLTFIGISVYTYSTLLEKIDNLQIKQASIISKSKNKIDDLEKINNIISQINDFKTNLIFITYGPADLIDHSTYYNNIEKQLLSEETNLSKIYYEYTGTTINYSEILIDMFSYLYTNTLNKPLNEDNCMYISEQLELLINSLIELKNIILNH